MPQRASHEAILMSSCPAILPSQLGLIFKAGIINRLIIIPGKASIIIFCFFFNCGKITYNMKPFLSVQCSSVKNIQVVQPIIRTFSYCKIETLYP